jgi:hypothetical protein
MMMETLSRSIYSSKPRIECGYYFSVARRRRCFKYHRVFVVQAREDIHYKSCMFQQILDPGIKYLNFQAFETCTQDDDRSLTSVTTGADQGAATDSPDLHTRLPNAIP